MVEETVGLDVILAFKGDIGDISNAPHTDFDNEGLVSAKARKILRGDKLQKFWNQRNVQRWESRTLNSTVTEASAG